MVLKETRLEQGISAEAYKELEDIVGSQWITDDPVACQAYKGRGYARELLFMTEMSSRPAVVVLPRAAEEISKIVKVCNRYKIPYVQGSSYWAYNTCARFRDDMLAIDLKRMDSCEFDEKNMYAIVEPHVIYGRFCEECQKRDLHFLNTGGGSASSVLANHLVWGCSPLNYRMGNSERRTMALEWVTPTGEIVRTGSLSTGKGDWSWGDGLGPNVNGILRGHIGWFGAMGIVTKMAVKVFPFQPDHLDFEGISPHTHLVLPERVRWENWTLPTREALEEAMYKLSEAEICAAITKVPLFWRTIARAENKEDFWGIDAEVSDEDVANTHIIRVLLIGYTSLKQLEYERKVLADIMEKLGGTPRRTRQTDESWFKNADVAGMWMMTNGYTSCCAGTESIHCLIEDGKEMGKVLKEDFTFPYGPMMDLHGEVGWFQSTDFGYAGYLEFLCYVDPHKCDMAGKNFDLRYMKKMATWYMEAVPNCDIKTGFHSFFAASSIPARYVGPYWHNYQVWQDRFKREFDPMGTSNPPAPYDPEEMLGYLGPDVVPKVKAAVAKSKRG